MSSHDFSQELHKRLAEQDARKQALQDEINQRKQLEEARAVREQQKRQQDLLREAESLFAPENWQELVIKPLDDFLQKQKAILHCSFLESEWYLRKDAQTNTWEILHQYGRTIDKAIPPENLEQRLLLLLAKHQRQEAQRQQEIRDAERKEHAEQDARLATHNQLEARLVSEQQRLQATLFVWPENLERVYIYQICYCKGGGWNGSQRAVTFEYEKAYTTADRLDAEGFIEIQETNGPQIIKLDAKIHRPVWRRLIVSKTTDFPSVLYESVDATLPNVGSEYNEMDHRYYLTENSRHYHLERRYVGRQPVLWLRQHILAKAAIRTQEK
jgi:hypothetical protein